jgi:hypothetical protein
MSKQCFFCKKCEDCSIISTTNEPCSYREAMSRDEIEATVKKDLARITEVAQKSGTVPRGVTIEEYLRAIQRSEDEELPPDFC